jgi:mRNA interferase MazF
MTKPVGPHRHVILAFISSSEPDPLIDSDVELHQGETDFPQTGLKVSSVLRLHRLMTVS